MVRYLVTAALPYVSAVPHLGNLAGSVLPADVFARFLRLRNEEVIYVCGTDDHGTPITVAAEKEGLSPQQLADKYYSLISQAFSAFGISFDNFSRTSREGHYARTQHFFARLKQNGLVALKTVQLPFCHSCKKFLPDRYVEGTCPKCGFIPARGDQCDKCGSVLDPADLIEPYCVTCRSPPEFRDTDHLFLELPKMAGKLEKWISGKESWPANARNMALSWIREGLKDRAITRDLSWGVPVPEDGWDGKVLYVWFDAPIGYISASAEIGREDWWKDAGTKIVHFIGKDNVPFHAIIWPSMLMGVDEGYSLPDYIASYEYLNWAGEKFSKSRGIGIWIDEAVTLHPADLWRYALIALLPQQKDSDFSFPEFERRANTELNDIFGNFVHRTLSFISQKFGGVVPNPGALTARDKQILAEIDKAFAEVASLYYKYDLKGALARAMLLAKLGNQYLSEEMPWKAADSNPKSLYISAQVVSALTILLNPVIPESCSKARKLLDLLPEPASWGYELVPAGTQLKGAPAPLFAKVSAKDTEAALAALRAKKGASTDGKPMEKGDIIKIREKEDGVKMEDERISIDEFRKIKLKVATVTAAERVEGTNKLLKLTLDDGSGTPRTIVSGIYPTYVPASIVGQQIVVVANLHLAVVRGVESDGMLLAAYDASTDEVSVLTPSRPARPGMEVC